ncbi:hypothetical protein [Streptomyces sp. NPDC058572]
MERISARLRNCLGAEAYEEAFADGERLDHTDAVIEPQPRPDAP